MSDQLRSNKYYVCINTITSGNNIQLYYDFTLIFSSCQIGWSNLYEVMSIQRRLGLTICRNEYVFCTIHSALCSFQHFFEKSFKFFRLFSPPPPSVHKLIEYQSFNAERFTLHISNDRFCLNRQGAERKILIKIKQRKICRRLHFA